MLHHSFETSVIVLIIRFNVHGGREVLLMHKSSENGGFSSGSFLQVPSVSIADGCYDEDMIAKKIETATGVRPKNMAQDGHLLFMNAPFVQADVFYLRCYYTEAYDGVAIQKGRECKPVWVAVDALPLDDIQRINPLDAVWLPRLLTGGASELSFYYDAHGVCHISESVDLESLPIANFD